MLTFTSMVMVMASTPNTALPNVLTNMLNNLSEEETNQ
jgi:hypothetical protein